MENALVLTPASGVAVSPTKGYPPPFTLTVHTQELKDALEVVKGGISPQGASLLPAYEYLLFRCVKGAVILSAANGTFSLMTSITTVSGSDSGELAVHGKLFVETISSLPAGQETELTFTPAEKGFVEIKPLGTANHYKIGAMDADLFPTLPKMKVAHQLKTTAVSILRALALTSFTVCNEPGKAFYGQLLEVKGPTISAAATDGHRMAVFSAEIERVGTEDVRILLPKASADMLQKLLPATEDELVLQYGDSHLLVSCGPLWMTSLLATNPFIDYAQVIPERETGQKIILHRADFLNRLAVNKIYTSDLACTVLLHQSQEDPKKLLLSSQYATGERSAVSWIAMELNCAVLEPVRFSIPMLREMISHLPGKQMVIECFGSAAGALIYPFDQKNYQVDMLAMPMAS